MPARFGLPAIAIACLLAVATPVLADDPTTTPEPATSTSTSEAVIEEPPPNPPIRELTEAGVLHAIDGPATVIGGLAGGLPTRGARVQLAPEPPSPFDPPVDGGNGRRVVYSKSQQTVWAYDENNTIIKMHRVSGRQDPNDPTPGVYQVWSRSLRTFSINNPSITWSYMVRFAKGDGGGNIGFHDIPYQYGRPVQTVDQLGEALSGGCVRQAPEDAIWMWNWAQLGTVVVVTP